MVQHADIDHTGVTGVGGSVATDAIWNAAGDLAVGTGADTAARLGIGGSGTVLTSNGTTATWASPSGAAPNTYEVYITSSVTVVNADTWYAGPTITTPAAGTYLVIASLTFTSSFAGVTSCSVGIGTGGTPTVGSGQDYVVAANAVTCITKMAKFTVNGSQDIVGYGLSARGSSVVSILDTATSGAITDKASSITAVLITSV